jgi:hypothetical protein
MFSVGIIGLPNVGKSTLFKALTKIAVPIANYPFTTIDPHYGIVEVKDERLNKIKELLNPPKVTLPMIEFIDIAGLVKGAHKGEGLGNNFLSNIGEADILLEVVRNFSISPKENKISQDNKDTQYQLWEPPNPSRDIDIIKNEVLKRDKKIISSFFEEIKKKDLKEKETAKTLLDITEKGIWIFDELKERPPQNGLELKGLAKKIGLLSIKPIIYLFNIIEKDEKEIEKKFHPSLVLNLKSEEEISDLSDEEKKEIGEKSHLDDIISTCYNKLDLITFYTIKGGREAKATELKRGSLVIDAAEKIHSDFKEKFISSEVLKFEDFINSGSWHKAKESGLIKKRGRDYVVQDGDIIEF